MNNDISFVKQNETVMESLRNIALDMSGQDRMHYVEFACEAIANSATQSKLISTMYKHLNKVYELDLGKIPDSRGDITKYPYYASMSKCIEILSSFDGSDSLPSFLLMTKLHNILLGNREDFVYGFMKNDAFIKTTYKVIVLQTCTMIEVCVSDYMKYIEAAFDTNKKNKLLDTLKYKKIVGDSQKMVKLFESGDWSILMKGFRKGVEPVATESMMDIDAMEVTVNMNISNDIGITNGKFDAGKAGTTIGKIFRKDDTAGSTGFLKAPAPLRWIVIFIGALFIVRWALYFFSKYLTKFSLFIRNQTELIKADMDITKEKGLNTVEKQKKLYDKLSGIADLIDYKILKAEKTADAELKAINKTELSPNEIKTIDGIDFDL